MKLAQIKIWIGAEQFNPIYALKRRHEALRYDTTKHRFGRVGALVTFSRF